MMSPLASYSDQELIDELMARRRLCVIRAQRFMSVDVLFKHREPMMLSMADQLSHEIGQCLIENQAQALMDLSEVEARELFLARSIERSNNLTYIQERADIVPAALRWMERTGTINWQQALDAVAEPAP
jgi:hypothetical protein